jgi:hypothetical protein
MMWIKRFHWNKSLEISSGVMMWIKRFHWMSWEKLSMHKIHGGMGFKNLSAFNLAMLGKQGWKLQTDTESRVSRLFKARYYPHSNYLASSIGHNPSYVWRSI